MSKKYPIVTLCGSTRFKKEFMQVQKELTLQGCIVISVGLFGHAGDAEVWEGMDENTLTDTKYMLDDMHKEKIRMADRIYVVNPGGYIGKSTWSEICYAKMLNKQIDFMCDIAENIIEREVLAHIDEAKRLADEQLDYIIHSNGYYNIEDYVYFKHKGKIILNPWVNPEVNSKGILLSDSENSDYSVDPFEYYGCKKTAAFVEEILMKSEKNTL